MASSVKGADVVKSCSTAISHDRFLTDGIVVGSNLYPCIFGIE